MEVMEAIKSRRSVRKYQDKKVEDDKIGLLLEACKWTPSANNKQPWDVIVVDDRQKIGKLSEFCLNQLWIKGAPLAFVICVNKTSTGSSLGERGQTVMSLQATAAAAQNIMLEAQSIGLGTCWVDPENDKEIQKLLECPSHIYPSVILTIGYPDPYELAKTPLRHEINRFSYYNKFGNMKKEIWPGLREKAKTATKGLIESLKKF